MFFTAGFSAKIYGEERAHVPRHRRWEWYTGTTFQPYSDAISRRLEEACAAGAVGTVDVSEHHHINLANMRQEVKSDPSRWRRVRRMELVDEAGSRWQEMKVGGLCMDKGKDCNDMVLVPGCCSSAPPQGFSGIEQVIIDVPTAEQLSAFHSPDAVPHERAGEAEKETIREVLETRDSNAHDAAMAQDSARDNSSRVDSASLPAASGDAAAEEPITSCARAEHEHQLGAEPTQGAEEPSMSRPAEAGLSASVRLRSESGEEKVIAFTHRPVMIKYKNELPMVVSAVDAEGEGAKAGVQVGDTLLACNVGLTFEGNDVRACHSLLQMAFNSLPLRVSVQLRSESGEEKVMAFTHRPVMITYKCELPIVVSHVDAEGEGAKAGVKVGDTLLACNGLSFKGKDAPACHFLLQEAFNSLPVLRTSSLVVEGDSTK